MKSSCFNRPIHFSSVAGSARSRAINPFRARIAAVEDRDNKWVKVTYRTCKKCGIVNERVDDTPRGPLGDWRRTAKFTKETAA